MSLVIVVIVFIVAFILICSMIIMGAAVRQGYHEGLETVRPQWDLHNSYLYLVCFVTLIMMMYGTVRLIESVADFVYPDPGYYSVPYEITEKLPPNLSEEERAKIEKERARLLEREEQWVRHQHARNLAGAVSLLIVALPIYLYHWRRIQHEART